ncbi:unnamed protein product [Schistosoma mattheei]|uniref:Uncharacterized protein n=1 Tax=Schistosoma mattheei TaxID=31246 RepID=A0A183NQ32_9TREM|nr:unnamed protein product [Schistosoma mattheei]
MEGIQDRHTWEIKHVEYDVFVVEMKRHQRSIPKYIQIVNSPILFHEELLQNKLKGNDTAGNKITKLITSHTIRRICQKCKSLFRKLSNSFMKCFSEESPV